MKQSTTAARDHKKASTGSSQGKTTGRPSGASEQRTSRGNSRGRQANAAGSQTGAKGNRQDGNMVSAGRGTGRAESAGMMSSFDGSSHLEKFFLDQLQDIYYAEHKIIESLPKMAEATTTEELQEAFEDHLHQTQRHVKRLEQAFQILGRQAKGKVCEAIEGIAREVESIIDETAEGSMTRDAALIMAAQKVEHYEIATYGGLLQLAITMGEYDIAELLDRTLIEEEETDALLTDIAECDINLLAEHEGNQFALEGVGGVEEEGR
jgi:ferritin-like metal-binding protein YciE